MKFQCEKGHPIQLEFPDEYFNKGPLIIPCPVCMLRYEVTKINGEETHKPYHHKDPLRFIAMHY